MKNTTDIIRDPTACPKCGKWPTPNGTHIGDFCKCVPGGEIDLPKPFNDITRLEVIQNSERKFVQWDCKIDVSIQDSGRTMKIFVEDK